MKASIPTHMKGGITSQNLLIATAGKKSYLGEFFWKEKPRGKTQKEKKEKPTRKTQSLFHRCEPIGGSQTIAAGGCDGDSVWKCGNVNK